MSRSRIDRLHVHRMSEANNTPKNDGGAGGASARPRTLPEKVDIFANAVKDYFKGSQAEIAGLKEDRERDAATIRKLRESRDKFKAEAESLKERNNTEIVEALKSVAEIRESRRELEERLGGLRKELAAANVKAQEYNALKQECDGLRLANMTLQASNQMLQDKGDANSSLKSENDAFVSEIARLNARLSGFAAMREQMERLLGSDPVPVAAAPVIRSDPPPHVSRVVGGDGGGAVISSAFEPVNPAPTTSPLIEAPKKPEARIVRETIPSATEDIEEGVAIEGLIGLSGGGSGARSESSDPVAGEEEEDEEVQVVGDSQPVVEEKKEEVKERKKKRIVRESQSPSPVATEEALGGAASSPPRSSPVAKKVPAAKKARRNVVSGSEESEADDEAEKPAKEIPKDRRARSATPEWMNLVRDSPDETHVKVEKSVTTAAGDKSDRTSSSSGNSENAVKKKKKKDRSADKAAGSASTSTRETPVSTPSGTGKRQRADSVGCGGKGGATAKGGAKPKSSDYKLTDMEILFSETVDEVRSDPDHCKNPTGKTLYTHILLGQKLARAIKSINVSNEAMGEAIDLAFQQILDARKQGRKDSDSPWISGKELKARIKANYDAELSTWNVVKMDVVKLARVLAKHGAVAFQSFMHGDVLGKNGKILAPAGPRYVDIDEDVVLPNAKKGAGKAPKAKKGGRKDESSSDESDESDSDGSGSDASVKAVNKPRPKSGYPSD